MEDFDPNKVAVEAATNISKEIFSNLLGAIPARISKLHYKYFEQFQTYATKTFIECQYVRTIIEKDVPVELDKIYVKSRYTLAQNSKKTPEIDDNELAQLIRDNRRIVVAGFGGIGKTIFCKYFWLSVFKNPKGKIPLFIELRHMRDFDRQDLMTYIRHLIMPRGEFITEEAFYDILDAGRFILIFDGFDEVPQEHKFEVQTQILNLASEFRDCGFVVSSRFDDRFSSWNEFYVYRCLPFNKAQALEVVDKTPFSDVEMKNEFRQEILEKRYDDYSDFFATPLLTLMMLMTYRQIRSIPDSPHLFYHYAFQTLYTLHDASKKGYQRKRFIDLGEPDYLHVFSLFCLYSYSELEFSFKRARCIEILEKIKVRIPFKFDAELFLEETEKSINLLYKDGDNYSFVHRSFQEYFAAYATVHFYPDSFRQVIKKIPVVFGDGVISLVRAMNPTMFDSLYVREEYAEHKDTLALLCKSKSALEIATVGGLRLQYVFKGTKSGIELVFVAPSFNSEIDSFCMIVCGANRDQMPRELSKVGPDFGDLSKKRFRSIVPNLKSLPLKYENNILYTAIFNFSDNTMDIAELGDMSDNKMSMHLIKQLHSVSIPNEIVNGTELYDSYTSGFKAKCVFVKRLSDSVSKFSKTIRGSGDDILGL